MMISIIRLVIRWKAAVWLLVLAGVLFSAYSIRTASLDAIPDISDPQIVVYVKWPRSPQLLETEVTEPLVSALVGSPDIQAIRGSSHMGYSFIYIVLNNTARREVAQQLVLDRINTIRPQLPPDATITLGPNASSMGWIYQYALLDRQGTHDLRELRLLNESQIKSGLQTVPGVAEVASVGGLEKQYQLKLFPPLLAKSGISLRQLINSVQSVFQEAGGRMIEVTNRDYQLRGTINKEDLDKLEFLVLGRDPDGKTVHLKDVGYFEVGYDQRRSTVDLDGKGEVVGGIVIMEQNRNVLAITRSVEEKLRQIRRTLPEGIDIVTTYDRSAWIWATLRQFFETLIIELAVLIVVTLLFLRNVRTAIGPISILLLSTGFTILPLVGFKQTVNLFSLAGLAIAIGEIADATIVIVENCTAELSLHANVTRIKKQEILVRSIASVTKPLLFSLLIILVSFLPVFFLEQREARLFDPLAYSKTFAMAFSTLLTIFLLPSIVFWIFKRESVARRNFQESRAARVYRSMLRKVIRYRYVFCSAGMLILIPAGMLLAKFPKDFMPEIDEGSILYMPTTLPGLPNREAGWILQQMDKKLKGLPEVERVFGKVGRADTSTDPAPLTMIETTVLLKPKSQWRKGMTKEKLVADMDAAVETIGYVNAWVQPIRARVMMQSTGIQTPVGIKVKGPEISIIEDISQQIEGLLRTLPGTKSVIAERISEGYYIDIRNDLERMAERGVTADEAMLTVRYAIGGDNILGMKQAGNTIVPLSLQYSPEYIDTLDKVRRVPVVASDGSSIPLSEIADVSVRQMPEMIRNDNGNLAGYIYVDLQNVTGPDYVDRAQQFLAKNLTLPPGYSIEWTGLYQYAAAARARLRTIVPLTLVIIFALLVVAFKSVAESILILMSVPFAMVGGVFFQWILGYSMTTAVIVGYISLFAVAVQTGIIMVIFIRAALENRAEGQLYIDAVIDGSTARLRPKLMTVAAIILSLLPVLVSSGPGMEIMKPIAAPSIGGMITSSLHVLFMTPCLFAIGEDIRAWRERHLGGKRENHVRVSA
ncbi:MAG: CusA/CzcA family heavy metal efflux RND transporter [Acidobacteriia bacterium]|nr:CusA/CzcA family heavy metal efflux RND transporter [Terriglobia bacterium]